MSTWGYLGPQATFTEAAARRLAPADATLVPLPDVDEVLRRVATAEVDHGVVPIENRLEGGVAATLDALADGDDLLLEAEVEVPVELRVAAVADVDLAAVTEVVSHPVALASCRRWLTSNVQGADRRPVSSTARSAQEVASSGRTDLLCIAAPLAVERHGLVTLVDDAADVPGNRTRFVQVGRTIPSPTGWDKTSMVVYIPTNRPGALLAMLEVFAERELDLTKIESRPTKHELGDYRFFVDVEGHLDDERVADAIAAVKRTQRDVKLLGSYPRIGEPGRTRDEVRADDASFRDAAAWVAAWRERVTGA